MVKVIVYAEGGVLPSLHDEALANAVTLGNSASLRQSFNRILSEAASRSDIMVEVDMRSSSKKTAKDFISCSNNTSALYVDYDKKDDIWSILNSYTGNLAALQERVFYMVQAMEAWYKAAGMYREVV